MKRLLIFMGIITVLGCGGKPAANIRDYIPGTYVKYTEGEFSKAWDTIRISLYDQKGDTYVVQQRVGYQRILEGKIQPREFKSDHFVAVFDQSNGQLQDLKSGKLLVFSPEKGTVLVGSAEYRKLE